jgi:hypothetical protein
MLFSVRAKIVKGFAGKAGILIAVPTELFFL